MRPGGDRCRNARVARRGRPPPDHTACRLPARWRRSWPVPPSGQRAVGFQESDPVSFRRLCDTDRLRAPKLQHAIQRTDGNANFSRSARIRARPQCVPDHPFVSADIGFNQRTPVLARRFLPGYTAALGNELQMPVALRGLRRGRLTQHTTRTRRHDDRCVRVTLGDFIVDIVPIERAVTDERYDRTRQLPHTRDAARLRARPRPRRPNTPPIMPASSPLSTGS